MAARIVVQDDQVFLIKDAKLEDEDEDFDASIEESLEPKYPSQECDFFKDGVTFDSQEEFESAHERFCQLSHSWFACVDSKTSTCNNRWSDNKIDETKFKYL
jgi:hypothetical protein